MIYALIAVFGLLFGSFFNVVGLRVPAGKSVIHPRSACPQCGYRLAVFELLPVFSYLVQKGRCRQCRGRIRPLYPMMELITALIFMLAYATFGLSAHYLLALTLSALLIIVTVSDLTYTVIPNKVLFVFFLIFFCERIIFPLDPWWDSLVGAGTAFILLAVIAVISKGGMGGGDVKLFTLIGFVVGLHVFLLAFFLATFVGAFVGIVGMIAGKLHRKSEIPFAPSIAVGTLLAFFYYEPLMSCYLALFA